MPSSDEYKSRYSGAEIDAAIGDVTNKIGKYATIDGDGGATNSENGEIWMYVGETSDSPSYGHFENGYFYKTAEDASGVKSFSRINIQPNGGAEWDNIAGMISALNWEDTTRTSDYRIGQVFFFKQIGVPEIWVSGIAASHTAVSYSDDDAFIDALNAAPPEGLHIGWYMFHKFETDTPTKRDFNDLAFAVQNLADNVDILRGSFASDGQILVKGEYKDVLWHGTQEQYDALSSHNPEVLYIITP